MNSGDQSRLHDRLLEHIRRYRLSVISIAAQMLQTPKRELREVAQDLLQSGMLGSESLYHTRRYLFVEHSTVNQSRVGPLSERAKVTALATLQFCSARPRQRELLTASEFQNHFSDLYRPSGSRRYVLDQTSGEPKLAFIRVDAGGPGRWDRVIGKARRDLDRHRTTSAYDSLIRRELFEVHILTALERKAERIQQTLTQSPDDQRIQVTALPDLIHLVCPQPCSSPR